MAYGICRNYSAESRRRSGSRQQPTQGTLLDWLRVEYGIEKPSNWLLSPFPLSSAVEERGMTFWNGEPRVALADSLTRGYCLQPLRGFCEAVTNTPAPSRPPALLPPKS